MSCIEQHSAFQGIGNLGFDLMKQRRMQFMIFVACMCILSSILLCVSMAGASADDNVIKSSAWTYSTDNGSSTVNGWLGLRAFYSSGQTINWDSGTCSTNYCDDCSMAGETALNSTAIAFLCSLILILTSAMRARAADMIILKVTSILCGLVGVFCLIIGMSSWANQCVDNLPSSSDYSLGPGLSSALVLFFILFIGLFIQLLTPVDFSGSSSEPSLTTAIPVNP